MRDSSIILTACLLSTAIPGCGFGPRAMRVSQTSYNEAIQTTTNEQLLLNLVRLRYRDVPLFVQIPSVSTQYEIRQTTEFGAALNENVGPDPLNPDTWNLGARFEFSERPTVTMVPLQENDFVKRMFMKYDPDTIALLHGSGWAVDRVLTLTVSRMNGLKNAVTASSPTPDAAPEFAEFARVTYLLRELQKRGEYSLETIPREEDFGESFSTGALPPEVVLSLAEKGYKLRHTEAGHILRTTRLAWELRLSDAGRISEEWKEVCGLLGLDPRRAEYEVMLGTTLPSSQSSDRRQDWIAITPRSLLGTLFLLSHAVEVPREHLSAGLATLTRDEDGQEIDWSEVTRRLLRVRCASGRPANAAVAVRFRGYWFFIEDSDRNSKSTFMLLNYLFALQAGNFESQGPVLTLPVGR